MKIKSLTVKKLHQICSQNKYVLLRERGGHLSAINCKISPLAFKKLNPKKNIETCFVSYLPCSLNEYISNKIPFITP
jgi:hypothetical protein